MISTFRLSRLSIAIAIGIATLTPAAFANGLLSLRRSVYRIQTVSRDTNFQSPWKVQPGGASSGTGFYIGDNRILTNAHVVASTSFITVQRDGDPEPVPAYVVYIAHDADLAILTIKDSQKFKGVEPLRLGALPRLRSPVSTIGYPMGGDQISITDGVVSRVSYRRYVHSGFKEHLLVQVDSAINPGNSGGPVVQGRHVVGVAFQSFTSAENTGYIIPTPVVRRFLNDVEDGRYDGHPEDGLTYMRFSVVNPANSEFHGLRQLGLKNGVKVSYVAPWAPTAKLIQPGDILVTVEGLDIGVDGRVEFESERVDFQTVFDLRQIGDHVTFGIVRLGKLLTVKVPVAQTQPHYFAGDIYAKHPKYFVYGGLVFTVLSRSYLKSWGAQWYKKAPVILRYLDSYVDFDDEYSGLAEIVVLGGRLPDSVNTYATTQVHGVLDKVDGVRITSLENLATALTNGTGEFIVMDFLGIPEPIVLNREKVKEANALINDKFGVVPDRWFDGPMIDGASSGLEEGQP